MSRATEQSDDTSESKEASSADGAAHIASLVLSGALAISVPIGEWITNALVGGVSHAANIVNPSGLVLSLLSTWAWRYYALDYEVKKKLNCLNWQGAFINSQSNDNCKNLTISVAQNKLSISYTVWIFDKLFHRKLLIDFPADYNQQVALEQQKQDVKDKIIAIARLAIFKSIQSLEAIKNEEKPISKCYHCES